MTKPSIHPHRWSPPARAPSTETTEPLNMGVYDVSGHGPEDVNRLPDGRIVSGLLDGRIIAVDPDTGAESVLVDTGGRPLGIELHPDGGLVVCDAHRGLLHVDVDDGTITTLTSAYDGKPYPAGDLVHDIDGTNPRFGMATGVRQVGGQVWLGSFETSTIAVLDVPPVD